ncbi:putative DNA binding domain-containing protein [Lutimaribacter sp. EGI FJ00015]|uniref:DNA binding domain-containing protein n=1 Tax=Lutimaribacter degradans TaxID=2945989 RepID=A0ACC5ZXH2_9RHOB|nr:ATP-binding protein [Lutimaribacter sp. EGI FJ00013]MCM2563032.1 putative DNA binding domain-containing protein [Lutimaribacter sp. EGI FJ00013]MCO0614200.1 putative DNA binding domain-containing protein [Lutimaribacter sp. EGI FJ00015]MCO0636177.1 putative DNA binding domain-containing protein [Lutimaribacter sp. EGI FJ00014]
MAETKRISTSEQAILLAQREGHFFDFKGKEIKPSRLSKTISAFANTSGGELAVGIEEVAGLSGSERHWEGFVDEEDANDILQVIHDLEQVGGGFSCQFLEVEGSLGLVLHVVVDKTQGVTAASDGKVYVRKGAQNLPVAGDALDRLKYDKGIHSYEDELLNCEHQEVSNSATVIEFMLGAVPAGEPLEWLTKQRIVVDTRPTVAATLLFSDSPQALLPKRSAVKILRYKTKDEAERDYLSDDPETVEGSLHSLIYDSVARVREIIEGIEKVGSKGMEKVLYPEEALHELLTNAVLHRDYSIPSDVQVRIFDNRVEIESPGRLPGHVTIGNITRTQFARNPKIVRLINKFKNPPNKDVGEGINTAFEAMEKLRLKKPEFVETDGGLVVTLRHQSLASPEQLVKEYLAENSEITNADARELTGIKSENTMKNVFYRLRDAGEIEQTPKVSGKKHSWRLLRPG